MKKSFLKLIALALTVLMLVSIPISSTAADEAAVLDVSDMYGEVLESSVQLKEIPLLIILVSFDANGNGQDDYDPSNTGKLYTDKTAPYYGEQWAASTPKQQFGQYFGETGYTLTNFYKEMTCGHVTYVPAPFEKYEGFWGTTCGVIPVTLKQMHPSAYTGSDSSGFAYSTMDNAVKATEPYIDFESFDKNNDGIVSQLELGVLILNAGPDHSSTGKYTNNGGHNNFAVHGTSQGRSIYLDGVMLQSTNSSGNVSNIGEYVSTSAIMPIGTAAHELAHNLGAEDLYNRKINASGTSDSQWPQPYQFSLQCNGNSSGGSKTPAYLDPYQRIYLGWVQSQVVSDGTYTLYSTCSGKYNVLRVNTPDPDEYFLIELRLKEGFESNLTSGGEGGIMVWHIDEGINRQYFLSGMACSSYTPNGLSGPHDPGIVPLFREGWNNTGSKMADTTPSDPYYYLSSDSSTAVCNTSDFHSPTNLTTSLNSYPSNWSGSETYNLRVEVLSAPGQEMSIKITTEKNAELAPVISVSATEKTLDSITFAGTVLIPNGSKISECGFYYSDDQETVKNGGGTFVKAELSSDGKHFTAKVSGLEADTKYFFTGIASNEYKENVSSLSYAYTATKGTEKTYFVCNMHRNLTGNDRAMEVKVTFGETLKYSFPMSKKGYVFGGWFYDESFTKPYDMSYTMDEYEKIELYAKWIEESRACTLELANAKPLYLTYAIYNGGTFSEPVPAPKDGYTFGGWYYDEAFTQKFDFGAPVTEAGVYKIYAKWLSDSGEETTLTPVTTETTAVVSTSSSDTETTGTDKQTDTTKNNQNNNGTLITVICVVAAVLIFGVIMYLFVFSKKKNKQ